MIGNHIVLVGCAFPRLVCAETAQFVMPDHQPFTAPKSNDRKSGAAAIKRAAKKRKATKRGRR